jgi:hypothetical protein
VHVREEWAARVPMRCGHSVLAAHIGRGMVTAMCVWALVCLAPASASAQQSSPCAPAQALLEQGKLKDAEAMFAAVVGDPCASQGAATVATRRAAAAARVTAAGEALSSGDATTAKRVATVALALDPENERAEAIAVEASKPDAPGLCAGGEIALARGDWQAAKDHFTAAANRDQTKDCAAAGLAKTERDRLATIPARVTSTTSTAVPWLALAGGTFLAVLLVTIAVRRAFQEPLRKDTTSGTWKIAAGCAVVAFLAVSICQPDVRAGQQRAARRDHE